jgi:hypothetical protein
VRDDVPAVGETRPDLGQRDFVGQGVLLQTRGDDARCGRIRGP